MSTNPSPTPTHRFVIAWIILIGGLVGFWCCRPLLGTKAFNIGQFAVLVISWKVAALFCLPPGAWKRFTGLRFLAYFIWPGMQPNQFLVGCTTAPGAPVPTVRSVLVNVLSGAALIWLAPRFLPSGTATGVRFWIGLIGFGFLLIARYDLAALIFRAMGFAVEKAWDCPVAATSLGDFWGRRWNRLVSGSLREMIFFPAARRAGPSVALLAVFLYSALYHEIFSFLAGSGYGGPALYFLVQYAGLATEYSRPGRRLFRSRPWVARAWTWIVVVLPIGLFLRPGIVKSLLIPLLEAAGVPGLTK
jgi:hypothetical protein